VHGAQKVCLGGYHCEKNRAPGLAKSTSQPSQPSQSSQSAASSVLPVRSNCGRDSARLVSPLAVTCLCQKCVPCPAALAMYWCLLLNTLCLCACCLVRCIVFYYPSLATPSLVYLLRTTEYLLLMYGCTYVCAYVWMDGWMDVWMFGCIGIASFGSAASFPSLHHSPRPPGAKPSIG
jgi:hypothetical protein